MKNPKVTSAVQEPLALMYRNGQPTPSGQVPIPRFSDISLTKESNDTCEMVIDEATRFDHPIGSEKECQDYIALHGLVDELLSNIRKLIKADREPLVAILSQIAAAVEPTQNKLQVISQRLREQINQWRAKVLDGARKEEERLRELAQEKHNEAKYTDDPKKSRQAKVQAKKYEEAAKEVAPKPEKGLSTEEYWEATITNRALAAKLPEEAIGMEVDQGWVNRQIKAKQHAGEKITPNIFPGLHLERKTRVRFH